MQLNSVVLAIFSVAAIVVSASPAPSHGVPYCKSCTASPNNCDITAPCARVFQPATDTEKTYCACRAGYRATGVDVNDITKQWRVNNGGNPWDYRVYVAPGVKCDTLCNNWTGPTPCSEVRYFAGCPA